MEWRERERSSVLSAGLLVTIRVSVQTEGEAGMAGGCTSISRAGGEERAGRPHYLSSLRCPPSDQLRINKTKKLTSLTL